MTGVACAAGLCHPAEQEQLRCVPQAAAQHTPTQPKPNPRQGQESKLRFVGYVLEEEKLEDKKWVKRFLQSLKVMALNDSAVF